MRRQKPDFAKRQPSREEWYDIYDDWELIESSLATQYSIRIRHHTDMPWTEFCTLVGGLMADTPLGQIVSIRAEKDSKVIKRFTPDQKRIHRDWQNHLAKNKLNNPEQLNKEMDQLTQLLANMFGSKEVSS